MENYYQKIKESINSIDSELKLFSKLKEQNQFIEPRQLIIKDSLEIVDEIGVPDLC